MTGGALDGRVAVVTGAGRGLGRAHALLLASEGARVVVNDIDPAPAEAVCAEIGAAGGEAVARPADVTTWAGGESVVHAAIDAFGRLDVLVNNAGFLRDRLLLNMSEDEWDDVVRVHLHGHAAPTRFAAAHWRERSKAGEAVAASVVNTTSTSGLLGNPGQANYGAAKAGIAAMTIILAQELAPYGVRVNAIAPAARTRLTETAPGIGELVQPPEGSGFDVWDPANAAPLVAHLASTRSTETGRVYFVQGGTIRLFEGWRLGATIERPTRWTLDELARELPAL